MTESHEHELNIEETQRAILVGLNRSIKGEIPIEESMQELHELTLAAGAEVLGTIVQSKQTIEARTYIGKGKVEEVMHAVALEEANLVVFNDELSGAQIRNLEEMIGVRVIDRTALILDIFALRAQSSIAKLQVEMAQLKYRLPRLKGLGESLSRTGGGIGTRGPGEQKLEIDRRRVNERMDDIKKRLREAASKRDVTRAQRKKNEVPIVALVGYTNAGKSTIMNKMIERFGTNEEDKLVFEKDMLFATLDTYHRKVAMEDHKPFILIDTVGFVSKLPHALVEAFKATLEEVIHADLLIHVVDASNPNYDLQINVTNSILKELGVGLHEEMVVFNKVDLVEGEPDHPPCDVWLSAKTGLNFEDLVQKIDARIFTTFKRVKMLIPYVEGAMLNRIMEQTKVFETTYEEGGTLIDVEVDQVALQKYQRYMIEA